MSKEVMINYSDDARMKEYIQNMLMPKVFHDIPLNVLNTGAFSIINEYMSQAIEQQSYTASFFFNESFITKAVLADSIYAEAAIFNIGYSYAIPSSCNFLLELKIEDIKKNAVLNSESGLYEFILDKNTKFNLSNGSVYSLDYDILIQYKDVKKDDASVAIPAWSVQYTNQDTSQNSIAKNKNPYIMYRVTDIWLCMYVQASEYERETHIVVNNMTNNIPNADEVITCNNHIAGFDIKYIDGNAVEHFLPQDHILPIHSTVPDMDPYVNYIMDNPQTIRFIFQLCGNKYFVPDLNSSFEITIYTCHGEAANFTAFKQDEQPLVITASNRYSNNANITKAAFVVSGSMGGTNIGTTETVRRETVQAYNTSNVISTDHDLDEYFKTFFFKNVLYPYFFKRRDDPWGRIWSGYIALKDTDDYIFRTNTLYGEIPYEVLYNNNDNTISANEIIIPPGWIWTYMNPMNENRYKVTPYTNGDGIMVETAKTLANISDKFVFANPFGIRIQKEPFAIGYFNPWVNLNATSTKLPPRTTVNDNPDDLSYIYHATPVVINIRRTYVNNFYNMSMFISPTISEWIDGSPLVQYVRTNAAAPVFANVTWNYFKQPSDLFCPNIPMLPLTSGYGYLSFNPEKTYFCVKNRNRVTEDQWSFSDIWIDDYSELEPKRIFLPITGDIEMLFGDNDTWGENGDWVGHEVYVSGDVTIGIYPSLFDTDHLEFVRVPDQNYYTMRLTEDADIGTIVKIVVSEAVATTLTKYGEEELIKIGKSYAPATYLNVYFSNGLTKQYTITNAANIYMPYEFTVNSSGECEFELDTVGPEGIILYADMKPSPDSGAIDYYRIPFNVMEDNHALFYIANKLLPMADNNLRVVLHAMINGAETGHIEMQPVAKEEDGSYYFDTAMYPLNQLVDVDNQINIASTTNGGGSWVATTDGSVVNIDASNPELKVSIFVRSEDPSRDSDIAIDDSFTGFRLVDQYTLDDVSLVQELKEMRSVVNFKDSSVPTEAQILLYKQMLSLAVYDESIDGNMFTLTEYAYARTNGSTPTKTYGEIKSIASYVKTIFDGYVTQYQEIVSSTIPASFILINATLLTLINDTSTSGDSINWETTWDVFHGYSSDVCEAFKCVNVDGGVEIQLVPFVEYSLMNSDRFPSFVSAFTSVHLALEPVIMQRLEGNNYLDCKLIGTYGLPHSYVADVDMNRENVWWPDLNVQVEFDVRLFNASMASNTINELRAIIKTYFNRLTSIHTAADAVSMDNNIYISHVIQQMESHPNVAYMKFKGWYTNEKGNPAGNYMDATVQAIQQKWETIDDFPREQLERYTPEMFTLEDANIVINLI